MMEPCSHRKENVIDFLLPKWMKMKIDWKKPGFLTYEGSTESVCMHAAAANNPDTYIWIVKEKWRRLATVEE